MRRQNTASTSTARPPTSTHIAFKYSIKGLTSPISPHSGPFSSLSRSRGLAARTTWPRSQRPPTRGPPSKWGEVANTEAAAPRQGNTGSRAENREWLRKVPSFSLGEGPVPNSRLGEGKESAEVRTERKKAEICPSRLMGTKYKSSVFFPSRRGLGPYLYILG